MAGRSLIVTPGPCGPARLPGACAGYPRGHYEEPGGRDFTEVQR